MQTEWQTVYRNDPKFGQICLGKQCRPRSDCSRSSLIRFYTVCHSICIVWTHYSMVEPHSSNFRVITTNFLGVWIFRKFTCSPWSDCSFIICQDQSVWKLRIITVPTLYLGKAVVESTSGCVQTTKPMLCFLINTWPHLEMNSTHDLT